MVLNVVRALISPRPVSREFVADEALLRVADFSLMWIAGPWGISRYLSGQISQNQTSDPEPFVFGPSWGNPKEYLSPLWSDHPVTHRREFPGVDSTLSFRP